MCQQEREIPCMIQSCRRLTKSNPRNAKSWMIKTSEPEPEKEPDPQPEAAHDPVGAISQEECAHHDMCTDVELFSSSEESDTV